MLSTEGPVFGCDWAKASPLNLFLTL
jgi:hypothetical protein